MSRKLHCSIGIVKSGGTEENEEERTKERNVANHVTVELKGA